ncbi:MAG: type fimbrial biosis protein pilO [Moraxellaceae bacterium]|jgi:type IV pilus assembly protein PilO|nr:type fimbrial biosis protein pilO [Moraxellaceae bacterium]
MKDATKKSFDIQEFIQTLNTLDPQNIGSWPLAVKILIYIMVFVVVLVLGYMLDLSGIKTTLEAGKQQQVTLLGDFEQKMFKAQNLGTYKTQLKDMEDSFGALLRQLPKDTEVPGLLEDITHTGIGSGVDFNLIDLGTEARREFYAEQPINIKAQGDYHAFGAFVSGIAALPRIVTLHDFSISPKGRANARDGSSPVLLLTIQAKTYRYSEAPPPKAKGKKKGGKKK